MKKLNIISAVLAVLLLLSCLSGCIIDARNWKDDLFVTVPDTDIEVMVKEWSFLVGSGAEIYLVSRDDVTHEVDCLYYLGECGGADDGATPFADGYYEITVKDGSLHVSWYTLCMVTDPVSETPPAGVEYRCYEIWHCRDFTIPTDWDTE